MYDDSWWIYDISSHRYKTDRRNKQEIKLNNQKGENVNE